MGQPVMDDETATPQQTLEALIHDGVTRAFQEFAREFGVQVLAVDIVWETDGVTIQNVQVTTFRRNPFMPVAVN